MSLLYEGMKAYDMIEVGFYLGAQAVEFLSNLRVLKYSRSINLEGKECFTLLGSYLRCPLFLLQKCNDCHCDAWTDMEEVVICLAFF